VKLGAVLLAAGSSSRLGQPKQLVRWEGVTLLRRAAEATCTVGDGPVVVVLGAHAERCLPELEGLPLTPITASDWQEGMAASLRAGITAVAHCDAALVLLCDQPHVTEAHLTALLDAFEPGQLVASDYGPHLGPPCVFDRTFFPELLALTGDQGARKLLQRHTPRRVPFPSGLYDIDTPADLPS
jgi:molybdenum cofactor cytidylyltransferase